MPPAGVALSILIVDDSADNLAILESRLREVPGWSLQIETVGSGAAGIEKLETGLFDLVFLHYRLPGEDGLEVLARIRQLYPKSAVVMTTSGGSEQAAVAAMKTGATDYLIYPELQQVDLGHLLRRINDRRYLVDQNMELRQVNQMKTEFIANVSHELRTPLSVIIGYAQTLKSGGLGPLAGDQTRAIDSIIVRAEQLLDTLNRILRLRENQEGKQRLRLTPLELGGFLRGQTEVRRRERERKGMTLSIEVPPEEAWVMADADRLNELVSNLLSNAYKFGPENSVVRLSLRAVKGHAEVMIADRGAGIAPEMLPRLFERFSATSQGPTREHPGLGLGLPLAKQIVEQHGGRIWLESPHGGGVAAFFTLPLSPKDLAAKEVDRPALLEKKRILIVEDNEDIIDVLKLFLTHFSQNIELSTAKSGFEALDILKQTIPHLIILDVMMPGMDGFEVISRLKKLPATERIPVLILTGYQQAAHRARQLGVEVLLKPFEKQVFIDKMVRLLNAAEAAK